jgi:hypothetical protein
MNLGIGKTRQAGLETSIIIIRCGASPQGVVVTLGLRYRVQYEQPYEPSPYLQDPASSSAEPSTVQMDTTDKARGRKRARVQVLVCASCLHCFSCRSTQSTPAQPASALVTNRRNPTTRSPTPPTRVIKSTYGGNLFTSDDVLYLKKYIDFCQEQGLVLRFVLLV